MFFLLSGFFLAALVGAIERSRKLLGVAGACLVVLVCIIVFVKPVQLPSLSELVHKTTTTTPATTTPTTAGSSGAPAATPVAPAVSPTAPTPTSTTSAPGASSTGAALGRSAQVALVR